MGMKILNLQMCFLQPTLHNDSNDVELKIRSRASWPQIWAPRCQKEVPRRLKTWVRIAWRVFSRLHNMYCWKASSWTRWALTRALSFSRNGHDVAICDSWKLPKMCHSLSTH